MVGGQGPSIDQIVGPMLGGVRPTLEFRVMTNEDETNRTRNNRMIFDGAGVPMDPREDAAAAATQLFAGIGMTDPAVARNDKLREQVFAQLGQELTAIKRGSAPRTRPTWRRSVPAGTPSRRG